MAFGMALRNATCEDVWLCCEMQGVMDKAKESEVEVEVEVEMVGLKERSVAIWN